MQLILSPALERIKQACLHSLTVAWAYLLIAGGVIVEFLPSLVDVLASPDMSDAVRGFLPGNRAGLWTLFVGAMTFLVRLRSLRISGD